jgi:4-hydroxybenzoate polyprenyltransferase
MTSLQNTSLVAPRTGAFWRAYAIHMRPYLLFVSGITGVAGLAVYADFSPAMGLLLFLAFFLTYGFGQALTDCFQTDTDSISSPYRPLVQGTIRREHVLGVSLAGLVGCGAVMAVGNPLAIPLAILGILGLATYTHFKRLWWAGPFYNAWIVVVVFLIGVLDGGPHGGPAGLWRLDVLLVALAVFFGYANFVLAGYFKDIWADRATGYDTLPVRYGMSAAALISDVFAAAAVLPVVLFLSSRGEPGLASAAPFIALGLAVCASVLAQVRLHRVRSEAEAHRAIGPIVHSYVLLLSAVALALRPSWILLLVAYYVAFCVTIWRRPARQQI